MLKYFALADPSRLKNVAVLAHADDSEQGLFYCINGDWCGRLYRNPDRIIVRDMHDDREHPVAIVWESDTLPAGKDYNEQIAAVEATL